MFKSILSAVVMSFAIMSSSALADTHYEGDYYEIIHMVETIPGDTIQAHDVSIALFGPGDTTGIYGVTNRKYPDTFEVSVVVELRKGMSTKGLREGEHATVLSEDDDHQLVLTSLRYVGEFAGAVHFIGDISSDEFNTLTTWANNASDVPAKKVIEVYCGDWDSGMITFQMGAHTYPGDILINEFNELGIKL